ncbi:MAG TPA: response regulator [Alphaproteobacteria bacterium]
MSQNSRAAGAILLVEDDPLVAEACGMLLEDFGHTVTRAASADEALGLLADGFKPDLVFSDIVMPGTLDGVELAQTLRERYPTMPVLLTTGFSKAAATAIASGFNLIHKPYMPNDLDRAIQVALEAGSPT